MGFIDIHHHIAYGIDDGPRTREEMYEMLERAAEEGVTKLFATSHYSPGIEPFNIRTYNDRIQEARKYLVNKKIALEIAEGAEVFYDPGIGQQYLNEGFPTLGQTNFALVEFQPTIRYIDLLRAVNQICSFGYNLIFAHVERYKCLVRMPHRAYLLKKRFPVYYQVNTSTILEKKNLPTRSFINRLLNDELIDFVASDAHNNNTRPCNVRKAFYKLSERYGKSYAEELFGGAHHFL